MFLWAQNVPLTLQGADQQISPYAKRILPNLDSFSSKLTALSLSGNRFTRLPEYMTKLTSLEVLDFSGTFHLLQCHRSSDVSFVLVPFFSPRKQGATNSGTSHKLDCSNASDTDY